MEKRTKEMICWLIIELIKVKMENLFQVGVFLSLSTSSVDVFPKFFAICLNISGEMEPIFLSTLH